MRPENVVPLTLQEHSELAAEMKASAARLRRLCGLVVGIYGPHSLPGFSFLKAMDALDQLHRELENQAAQDLQGYGVQGLYL
jgi:hypothetical protein